MNVAVCACICVSKQAHDPITLTELHSWLFTFFAVSYKIIHDWVSATQCSCTNLSPVSTNVPSSPSKPAFMIGILIINSRCCYWWVFILNALLTTFQHPPFPPEWPISSIYLFIQTNFVVFSSLPYFPPMPQVASFLQKTWVF